MIFDKPKKKKKKLSGGDRSSVDLGGQGVCPPQLQAFADTETLLHPNDKGQMPHL